MKEIDVVLHRLAARQLGLVHRTQAMVRDMSSRQIDCRIDAGLLVPVQPSVYRLASAPTSWKQSLLAAGMAAGPGAVASHRSAAVMWELRGVAAAPVEITVAGSRVPRLRGDVVVHRTGRLEAVDVTRRGAVPVSAPALTLFGLAAVAPAKVEQALEDALLRGLISMAAMEHALARLSGKGRRGGACLRQLLAERAPGAAPTESPLEDAIVAILRAAGLPEPVRQFVVDGVRLDLAYPSVRLGIEADSRIWHGGRLDVQRNSSKANALTRRGWRVLHFTWADATQRPSYVVECVDSQLGLGHEAVG